MRITVCELPHEPAALEAAWADLCEHTTRHASELVLLPECAFVPAMWETDAFECGQWEQALRLNAVWLGRLHELGVAHVVGTRPIDVGGRPFNQGYIWSPARAVVPLRRKYFLPDEPGSWEARWFDPGDPSFPVFRAGALSFGLNICTELWALETYAAYAEGNVQVVLSPRATGVTTRARWLSVGIVAAVRSGAYSVSSNRVDATGACGGGGWIINPEGQILATTTPQSPCATVDVDLAAANEAREAYPRNVFARETSGTPFAVATGSGHAAERNSPRP
ncbi:MAG TPA: carbon-nitrogen hydrolase family protein [Gemmatimonadales bacterium]|nr:carbon-nitrogen hydrolase family protein [Gemmatimonadales bacterium]